MTRLGCAPSESALAVAEGASFRTARRRTAACAGAWAVLAAFLLGCTFLWAPGQADAEDSPRLYPFPIGELEQVITGWLERSGFEVESQDLDMGRRRLTGRKNGESWEVRLTPRSPLASQALAVYSRDGQPEAGRTAMLEQFIDGYLRSASLRAGELSNMDIPAEVLERIETVVCIRAGTPKGEIQLSGVVVGRDGLILSVAHALKDAKTIRAVLYDGVVLSSRLARLDHRRDLALIRSPQPLPAALTPRSGRGLVGVGERLYSVGCPLSLGGTVFQGTVNGPPRRVGGQPLWVVNMEIHPGSSGSPVFDVQGNLVGMVKGRYRGTESLGFLIPLETILAFLDER